MNNKYSFLANQTYKQKYISPLLIFLLTLSAWFFRFIQDDAFISLRYAKNFAKGLGLVYNSGECVEGYTNFLWTLYLSIPHYLKIDPVIFSQVTGVLLFALSLFLVLKISMYFTDKAFFSFLPVLLTGTNYTFLCYATGGLETQLLTVLLLEGILICLRLKVSITYQKILLLSLTFSALVLTRPDSIIFIFIITLYSIFIFYRKENAANNTLILLLPFTAVTVLYLFVKYNYYGDLIANTVYAKMSGGTSFKFGFYYIYTFFTSYWLAPVPFLFAFTLIYRKFFYAALLFLLSIIIAMFLFVLFVGGDFMEFRFFVPVIPLFFVLTSKTLELLNKRIITALLILLVLTGSVFHALNYRSEDGYKIHSIKELTAQMYAVNFNWQGIGKKLKEYFPNGGVTLATTAAGAIPYYSELTTIDMHGLTDRWISRHGKIISHRPGHQRLATVDYLIKRKVNILIGHPFIMWKTYSIKDITPLQFKSFFQYNADELPPSAQIVKIPIEKGYCLFFIYLVKNKKTSEIIRREGMETKDLEEFVAEKR